MWYMNWSIVNVQSIPTCSAGEEHVLLSQCVHTLTVLIFTSTWREKAESEPDIVKSNISQQKHFQDAEIIFKAKIHFAY